MTMKADATPAPSNLQVAHKITFSKLEWYTAAKATGKGWESIKT